MPFSKLGLSESLLQAIVEEGYMEPTPIQAKAIPLALAGKDLVATAQTGSGKTASFVLPMLAQIEKLQQRRGDQRRAKRVSALVLVPTRELAIQVAESAAAYGRHQQTRCLAMYGGSDIDTQKQQLLDGVDILVATPGRLLDMVYQRAVQFDELTMFVLDEADRMLDMGFIGEINKIIERLPAQRQNLLFSATMPSGVRGLVKHSIPHAVEISIDKGQSSKPQIEQWLITVDKDKKSALLSHLITENAWDQALIFISTKHGAAKLVSQLEKRGITAECIHGDRSQAMRAQVLDSFKTRELKFLVATGIAARGIDVDNLSRVVNYDLPYEPDDYIHRIGRTGRAGASGEAVSLVSKDDFKNLCAIESRLGHIIERRDLEAFTPKKVVPISILDYVPLNQRDKDGAQKERKPRQKKRDNTKGKVNRLSGGRHEKSKPSRPQAKSQDDKAASRSDGMFEKKTAKKALNPWSQWENKNKKS